MYGGFSNYAGEGAEVTLSAPGADMFLGLSKAEGGSKAFLASGTSFSTPQVTATIALMQSINPKLNADDIKSILVETAYGGVNNNEESILIPEGMGAGVLRVDEAVIKVINELREENNLEPYDKEYLLNLALVNLKAEGSGKEYTLSASVIEAKLNKVNLSIEIIGEDYSLKGNKTKTVSIGETATWDIIIKNEVTVKIIRSDNRTCSTLVLKPDDITSEANGDIVGQEEALVGTLEKYIFSDVNGEYIYAGNEDFDSFVFTLNIDGNGGISGEYKTNDGFVNTEFSGKYDCSESQLVSDNPLDWYYYCTIPRSNIVDTGDYSFINYLPAEYTSNTDNVYMTFEFSEIDGVNLLYDWGSDIYFIKK